jgi:hypothetical protein
MSLPSSGTVADASTLTRLINAFYNRWRPTSY